MSKFEVGTVVKLKSGGPKMTVVRIQDSAVTVKWSDSGVIHSDEIPDGALEYVHVLPEGRETLSTLITWCKHGDVLGLSDLSKVQTYIERAFDVCREELPGTEFPKVGYEGVPVSSSIVVELVKSIRLMETNNLDLSKAYHDHAVSQLKLWKARIDGKI